jgi:hypothetical protein
MIQSTLFNYASIILILYTENFITRVFSDNFPYYSIKDMDYNYETVLYKRIAEAQQL